MSDIDQLKLAMGDRYAVEGEVGCVLYFVMPFVDGESLRDRLSRRGELPVHEAVRVRAELTRPYCRAYTRRRDSPRNGMVMLPAGVRVSSTRGLHQDLVGEGGNMAVAVQVKPWTLDELLRLPEDGNRYELVRGELFVTPPPSDHHETIAARFRGILGPYVETEQLGMVFGPRAVFRFRGSQAEPDLMVRALHPNRRGRDSDWTSAPVPILVVEIASSFTRLRDLREKRELYMKADIAAYWIFDAESEELRVITPGAPDRVVSGTMTWAPAGSSTALVFEVGSLF